MQAYAKSAIKIAIGLLCGSLFNEKQGAVFAEALLINLTAWLSGTWFDLDSVGGAFKAVRICSYSFTPIRRDELHFLIIILLFFRICGG